MKPKISAIAALALILGLQGCLHFRQPQEFKNRKSKEDPPILNQLPAAQPRALALKPAAAQPERI